MRTIPFEDIAEEYDRLWQSMKATGRLDASSAATAAKIIAGKPRYQKIEKALGVPWFFVGVIHALESGCRWGTHLHNGDPLTARTKNVPAGRPAKGSAPFGWEASAIDALELKGLQQITEWTPARICYELERYNGFGYRLYHKETLSPYLWSGTFHYGRGKYVSDGKWSADAVSQQTGAIYLLARIGELDETIQLARPGFAYTAAPAPITQTVPDAPAPAGQVERQVSEVVAPAPAAAPAPIAPDPIPAPESYAKAEEPRVTAAAKNSWTITGALLAGIGTVVNWAESAMHTLLDTARQVSDWSPIQSLVGTTGVHLKGIGLALVVAGLVLVVGRRLNAAYKGKEG